MWNQTKEIGVSSGIMPQYVKVSEYAQIKGIHKKTVYRWIENGDIDAKEIDGVLHVKSDADGDNAGGMDATNATLMQQNSYLQETITQLQSQLTQAHEIIKEMQQDRQRSDTIVLQLTQQVEQLTGQNQLLLEDLRPKRRWYQKIFAWNGT